jgi:hypothetical protein
MYVFGQTELRENTSPASASNSCAVGRARGYSPDCRSKLLRTAAFNDPTRFSVNNVLGEPTRICTYDGELHCLRFEYGVAKPLRNGCVKKQISPACILPNGVSRLRTNQINAIA